MNYNNDNNNQINRGNSIYDDNFVESYMDQPKKNQDKTKKIIIAGVIILAVIAAILVITVILNNNSSNNNQNDNDNQNNNQETLSVNDETVKKLYEMINKVQQRGICTGSTYYLENNEIKTSKYDNEKKYEQAFVLIDEKDIKTEQENGINIYRISNATMDDAMKKFFGPKVTYNKTGDHLLVPIELTNDSSIHLLFIYDNDKEEYMGSLLKGTNSSCEPSGDKYLLNSIYTKLISALKKDDYIILTQKYIITDNISKIYNDPKKEELITTISPKTTEEEAKKFNISQFLSKAKTVSYTFKLDDDNNYYFYSSKLVD